MTSGATDARITHVQETGARVRRRGILAVAAAAVATLAARGGTEPPKVAADNGTWTFPYYGVSSGSGNPDNALVSIHATGSGTQGMQISSYQSNAIYANAGSGYGVFGFSDFNTAILGQSNLQNSSGIGVNGAGMTGVQGQGGGDTSNNTTGFPIGVRGSVAGSGYGIYGQAGNGYGVYGNATNGGVGVGGYCASNSAIYGQSSSSNGVYGVSTSGTGIHGAIPNTSSASNTVAVLGVNQSTGSGNVGVLGSAPHGYGVLGVSTAPGYAGLTGSTSTANVPAFAGGSSVPSANAAQFYGGVYIDCTTVAGGQFVVNPMTAKSGLVQHPDGSHRLLYSVEAPESWVEDVGTGQVVNGTAEVKLDPDFAAVIETGRYYVFLTEQGTHHHLAVTQQTATGFTVEADAEIAALKGKKASDLTGAFTWRVMATPKTGKPAARLAKYDLPVPLHIPTADDLPKPAPPEPKPKPPALPVLPKT